MSDKKKSKKVTSGNKFFDMMLKRRGIKPIIVKNKKTGKIDKHETFMLNADTLMYDIHTSGFDDIPLTERVSKSLRKKGHIGAAEIGERDVRVAKEVNKKRMKKVTGPELKNKGGYVKEYARGGGVRKARW